MPRKLHYSLATLAAIALIAASASNSAQAQAKFKNTTGLTNTNMRPLTTTHGSNRNDGYVQQSKQGAANQFHPTQRYDVQVGWSESAQGAKGQSTGNKGSATKGVKKLKILDEHQERSSQSTQKP